VRRGARRKKNRPRRKKPYPSPFVFYALLVGGGSYDAEGRRIKTMGQAKQIRVIKGGRAARETQVVQ